MSLGFGVRDKVVRTLQKIGFRVRVYGVFISGQRT